MLRRMPTRIELESNILEEYHKTHKEEYHKMKQDIEKEKLNRKVHK